MTQRSRSQQLQCGEFTVEIPADYDVRSTDGYHLRVGTRFHALYKNQGDDRIRPRDPNLQLDETQLSLATGPVRSYEVHLGHHVMTIGAEYLGPDCADGFKDRVVDAKRRVANVRLVKINGIPGFFAGRFSKGPNVKEWCFGNGSTILSMILRGFGVPSAKIQSDVKKIVRSIRY